MSYLAIARGVVTDYERNELDERSPVLSAKDAMPLTARITAHNPALVALLALQDEIVSAASAAQSAFDRQYYDALWERWHALQQETV